MYVYIFLILICVASGYIYLKVNANDKKSQLIIMVIPFLALFMVSGFRYQVGTDYTNTYVYTFNQILFNVENVRIDFGFYLLNKIIIFFTDNSQWVFIITSFIMSYFVCRTVQEQSRLPWLSFLIYICGTFYFFSLNGIRQAIAIAIFYYSLKYLKEKNLKKYLLLNLIGFLFHNTAILFVLLYFVLDKMVKRKYKFILLIVIYFTMPFLLKYIYQILINTKYGMYITNGAYTTLATFNISSIINLLLFLAYETFLKEKEKEDVIYSNCHFMGVIVSMFLTTIPLAIRLFIAFRYIEFLSVTNLICKIKINKKMKSVITLGVIILYIVYFIHGVYMENGNDVLPYQTVFFK